MSDLDYTVRGESGPALALVHGFPLDRRIWEPVVSKLPPSIRLVLPDLRGHGKSALPPGPCSIDDYARDMLGLMEKLAIPKFFFAGHSMAGYILFALLRIAPDRIAGGALVSSRALPDTEDGKKTREATAQRAEKEGPGFLAATMPERAVGSAPPPGVLDTLRTVIRSAQGKGVAAASRAMASRPDSTPGLPKIAVPMVVFAGRGDKIVPPAESEAMATAIPGAKLVWCESLATSRCSREADLVARELASLVTRTP
jgi:pimeloyl-ACP methyl ester carboxylesterase